MIAALEIPGDFAESKDTANESFTIGVGAGGDSRVAQLGAPSANLGASHVHYSG